MDLPSISHPTDRPNYAVVNVGPLTLWFSYQTCIAFRHDTGIVVSENLWGPTTGKHLGMVDYGRKSDRLPRDQFVERLTAALAAALPA